MSYLKNLVVRAYLWLVRLSDSLLSGEYKKHKAGIRKIEQQNRQNQNNVDSVHLEEEIFLFCSFRANSPKRQQMLELTIPESLGALARSNLDLWVLDASSEKYQKHNKEIFEKISGLNLGYFPKNVKLHVAFASVLKEAAQPYICNIFDDQPIIGLNKDFLVSACRLLKDFKGHVDMVLIESPTEFKINESAQKISYKPSSLEFIKAGEKPVGIVKYGDYEFAILHNYHYGFFFNTFIADGGIYAQKLKWYMEHIDSDNSQQIELAGMKRRGPVYDFIAVPLQVGMFNIDVAHSEISIRGVSAETQQLYEAMSLGYHFEAEK